VLNGESPQVLRRHRLFFRAWFRSKKEPSPPSQLRSACARYFLRAVSAVSDKSTSRISLFNVSSLIA
jgi:hypothetical protein